MGCYIWYSKEGTGRGRSPPRPLLAVPNVTAHPSTASAPINALLYNSPLLCSFNVGVKGLITVSLRTAHDVLSHKAPYGPRPKNSRRNRPTLVGHMQAPYQLVWFRIIAVVYRLFNICQQSHNNSSINIIRYDTIVGI